MPVGNSSSRERRAAALKLSTGVLIDDDGRSVLVVNAPEHAVLEDRERALELLGKLDDSARAGRAVELRADEEQLVDRLVALGAVYFDHAERERPAPAPPVEGPSLATLTVEVEFGPRPEPQLAALRAGLERLHGRVRGCRRIVYRLYGDEPLAHLEELAGLVNGVYDKARELGYRDGSLSWEIHTPLTTVPDALEGVLDSAHGEVQCVAEDRSELDPRYATPEHVDHQHETLARWSAMGFSFPVRVWTRFPDGLVARVERWLESNERSGVRLAPILLELPAGGGEPLRSKEDLRRAREALAELDAKLGPIAHLCEPWRGVLVHALTRGRARAGWRKRLSTLHVDADGRWARSSAHAALGLRAELDELFPPGGGVEPAARAARAELPDCGSCGFEPMCDGFGSPEHDALLARGATRGAAAAARLACELRMDTLSGLLDQLRGEAAAGRGAGRSQVVFEDGRVELRTVDGA